MIQFKNVLKFYRPNGRVKVVSSHSMTFAAGTSYGLLG